MFDVWLPLTRSSEGLFQNATLFPPGLLPVKANVDVAKVVGNADELPATQVPHVTVSANMLPLSATTAADRTRSFFIVSPPTNKNLAAFQYRQKMRRALELG
jgi:hypothetical protein